MMGKKKVFIPNCRKEVIDDVRFVICNPELKDGDIRLPQGKVIFKEVSSNELELIKEEKVSEETTEKIKEYMESLGFKVKL